MADPNENIRNGKRDLKEISDIVGALDDGFQSLSSRLTDLAEGLTDIVDDARAFSRIQKDTISTLNKLARTNEKLIKNQIDLNNGQLSSKKINEQINEITSTREILNQRLNNLLNKQTQGLILSKNELDEIKTLQNGIAEITEEVTDNYQRQLSFAKEIEKKAGGFQKLAGVVKSIPGLKGIAGPFQDAADAASKAAASGKSSFQIFKAGAGGLASFLKGPIWITALIAAAKFFKEAVFGASKLVAQFKRDFIVSAEEAENIRQSTYDVAFNSKNLADTQGQVLITQQQIVKSLEQANQALGVQMDLTSMLGKFGEKLLVQTAILRDNFGLSEEAIAGITQESIRTGEETENITKNTLGNVAAIFLEKKLGADFNKILEQASKTTGVLRLSFKGSTEEIAKGVAKLQLMGLTLQDTQKIAGGLLDFESSISSQIEAELLTSKQINVERARLLSLNKDFVGVGKELVNQGITYNYLQGLNTIQLEAQAKVFNLTGDELSDIIKKQEESNALSARAARFGVQIKDINKQSLAELYEVNKNVVKSQEDLAKILGEEIYSKKQSEDAQTKFNKALDQAKSVFERLASSGAIDKFANYLIKFVNALSSGQSLASILFSGPETKEQLQRSQMLSRGVSSSEIKQIQAGEVITAGTGPKFAKGGIVTKPIYNATVGEAGPEAIIPLGSSEGLGGLIKAQQETNMLLKQLLSKNTNIYMDSNKVSTTISQNSFNVGQ